MLIFSTPNAKVDSVTNKPYPLMWYDDDDTCVYLQTTWFTRCARNGAMNNNSRATKIFGLGVMKLVETGSGRIFIEFRYDFLLSEIIVEEP